MKKVIRDIISLILAASLFTGCSMGNTAGVASEASGSAIRSVVTGSSVMSAEPGTDSETGTTRQAGGKYANDHNKYAMERGGGALFQGKLDTESDEYDKSIEIEIDSLEWVANEWIYYTVYVDNAYWEGEELWRMPIEKTKKGDKVRKDKKEKLITKDEISVVYATDSYLIMVIGDKEGRDLCKYNLNSGKQKELIGNKELGDYGYVLDDDSGNPHVVNGDLVIEGERDLYRLDPETGESAALCPLDSEGVWGQRQSGSILYLLMNESLYSYDGTSRRVAPFIRKKTLEEAVEKLGKGKIWDIDVSDLYVDGGRVYLVMDTERLEPSREDTPYRKEYYNKTELFSLPEDDPEQLCREDKLIDYLDRKGIYEEGDSDDPRECDYCVYYHTESIEDVRDGMVYACYQTENYKEYHYVKYDTRTQKIQKCSWEESAAGEQGRGVAG